MEAYGPLHKFFGPLPAFLYCYTRNLANVPSGLAVTSLSFALYVTQPFYADGEVPYWLPKIVAAVCVGECYTNHTPLTLRVTYDVAGKYNNSAGILIITSMSFLYQWWLLSSTLPVFKWVCGSKTLLQLSKSLLCLWSSLPDWLNWVKVRTLYDTHTTVYCPLIDRHNWWIIPIIHTCIMVLDLFSSYITNFQLRGFEEIIVEFSQPRSDSNIFFRLIGHTEYLAMGFAPFGNSTSFADIGSAIYACFWSYAGW